MTSTPTPAPRAHVVVVGAGIAGLTAALDLAERPGGPRVTVLEADDRVGGKIRTGDLDGIPVDDGPDAFLARVPGAAGLCRQVGLGDELTSPATSKAFVWRRGALRPIPEGLVFGAPADARGLAALVRSGLLGPAGVVRAGADLVLPRWRPRGPAEADCLGALVRRRLGAEVLEAVIDPLLGGVYAGDADRLSLAATAPPLAAAATGRSLLAGLRRPPPAPAGAGPLFATVSGGLERLPRQVAEQVRRAGGTVVTGHPVDRIERRPGGGFVVRSPGRTRTEADAVVLATPGFVTARLLADLAPAVAAGVGAVPHASVVLTSLLVRAGDLPGLRPGSGFLVPRREGLLISAVSWGSQKWPQWHRPGRVVLRVSAGRDGDDRPDRLDDGELLAAVRADLATTLGLRAEPLATRISRWPRAFPQYRPGHTPAMARLQQALAEREPGLVLAGAAYGGVGIPACVRSAQQAAAAVAAHLDRSGG